MASGVPMNRASFPYQYDQSISKMFYGQYTDLPSEFGMVAKVSNFPKGKSFSIAELSPLGSLRQMGEGDEISFDTPVEGHKQTVTTVKFGLGFQLTEEAADDDFHGQIMKLPQSLARSAATCRETNFWNLFNNGFTTTLGWDGKAVFADDHATMKSGTTIDNKAAADLSQTSLEAGFEYFDNLVDEAGMKILVKPDRLVIPTKLKWVANDLLKATGRVWDYSGTGGDMTKGLVSTGSAGVAQGPVNGLLNGVNPANGLVDSWRVIASHYLTDDDAWFLLGPDHTFSFYWKKKPTMASSDSFGTDSRLYKVTMRFATAVHDYKCAYGSTGA